MSNWRSTSGYSQQDPMAASRAAILQNNAEGIHNPNQTLPPAGSDWRSTAGFSKQSQQQIPGGDWRGSSGFSTQTAKPAAEPSLGQRLGVAYENRVEKAQEAANRGVQGQQTMGETYGQMALQGGVGFAGDVAGELLATAAKPVISAAKAVMPANVERGLVDLISPPRQIQQAIGAGVQKFQEQSPRTRANVESVANLLLAAPLGIGGKAATETLETGTRVVGKTLVESGERGIEANRRKFIEELVAPVETKKVADEAVGRTEVKGKFFKEKVTPLEPVEQRAADEIFNIPKVKEGNLKQENYNFIKEHNHALAEDLIKQLKENDIMFTRKEVNARLQAITSNLEKNPFVAEEGQAEAVQRTIAAMMEQVNNNKSTASGLLQARKDFDNVITEMGRGKAFSPNSENAVSLAVRQVRQTVNDIVAEKTPNVEVRNSLSRQSALYRAMDNIEPKASVRAEPRTAGERFRKSIGDKTTVKGLVASGLGAGALGTAVALSPLTALGTAGAVAGALPLYGAYKAASNPSVHKNIGKMLMAVGKERKVPEGVSDALKTYMKDESGTFKFPREYKKIQYMNGATKETTKYIVQWAKGDHKTRMGFKTLKEAQEQVDHIQNTLGGKYIKLTKKDR